MHIPTNTVSSLSAPSPLPTFTSSNLGGLVDIFSDLNMVQSSSGLSYEPPKQIWLPAQKGKGLEISGTFTRKNGLISMCMDFTNKALQPLSGFALQINKNSFGLIPSSALQIAPSISPNQTVPTTLVLNTNGPTMKTQPLTNLQVKSIKI